MKNSKGGVPKEFFKYFEAYVWLKGEPKFGTNILSHNVECQEDFSSRNGDVRTSRIDSE